MGIFMRSGLGFRAVFMLVFFLLIIAKVLFLPFMLIDDSRRFVIWLKQKTKKQPKAIKPAGPHDIPRSEFLMKAGLLAGSIPLATLTYGTISGVYDYQVKHRKL